MCILENFYSLEILSSHCLSYRSGSGEFYPAEKLIVPNHPLIHVTQQRRLPLLLAFPMFGSLIWEKQDWEAHMKHHRLCHRMSPPVVAHWKLFNGCYFVHRSVHAFY
jgi:hypothetical protein